MIDVTRKDYRITAKIILNPFKGSKLTCYRYDIIDVNYHEGTDTPFFSTESLLEKLKKRVSELDYKSIKDDDHDAAKKYFRRELKHIQEHIIELTKSLDNLAVKNEDFKQ